MTTEARLMRISREIGRIAERDGRFTEGLAKFLDDSGAELMGLTVLELLELVEIYRETFDQEQPIASHGRGASGLGVSASLSHHIVVTSHKKDKNQCLM